MVLSLVLVCSPSVASDDWDGDDKLMHLTVGTIIGLTAYAIHDVDKPLDRESDKLLSGVKWAFVAGFAKEAYDFYDYGYFSYKDLAVTTAGGAIGGAIGVSVTYTDHILTASKSWRW